MRHVQAPPSFDHRQLAMAMACMLACACASVTAHDVRQVPQVPVPEALRVRGELAPLPGVVDLKFSEFFKLPVGPRGLEPSPKLLGLHGHAVRLVGYMARQDRPSDGMFILSPLPVHMGVDDDSFADDLPANAAFVRLAEGHSGTRLPYMPGLLALTGTLQVGAAEEADGRVSAVRLLLLPDQSRALSEAARSRPALFR